MPWPRKVAAQVVDVLTGLAAAAGAIALACGSMGAALGCAVVAGLGLALMNLRAFRED